MSTDSKNEKVRGNIEAQDQDPIAERYETVIGLEVHVQLGTRTKLFCGCENRFGAPPNTLTCPICSGHPGVLPVPNRQALRLGILAALSLDCDIQEHCKFDRKHYYYPDLPKGYQISQFDLPFALNGGVRLSSGKVIGLERIHLEEDAGKNLHADGHSHVDLNRAGVPLIEIVGMPEIRSPEEAHDYLESLKRSMRYAGVSECDMEKGSLRCDANISLRQHGASEFGTKVEIKNLNSFKKVVAALQYERKRQAACLDRGEPIHQETRLFDDASQQTRVMRTKEEAMDYRFFPEPDIPPFEISTTEIEVLRPLLPERHWERRARFMQEAGLGEYDSMVLTLEQETADYFEAAWKALGPSQEEAKLTANWVMTEVLRLSNEKGLPLSKLPIDPGTLASLCRLIQEGKASNQAARKVFKHMAETGDSPEKALEELGLAQISDPAELEPIVQKVIENSKKAVKDYFKGKKKALDAMKGGVMRETRGRANPGLVSEILLRLLENLREK